MPSAFPLSKLPPSHTPERTIRPVGGAELGPGEVWSNEPGVIHALEALEDSVVLEVPTPELDDVVRLLDRYGRVGT
ncbi:MAG: hypothetical protein WB507_05825 [Solirubrobacterales bacterium]